MRILSSKLAFCSQKFIAQKKIVFISSSIVCIYSSFYFSFFFAHFLILTMTCVWRHGIVCRVTLLQYYSVISDGSQQWFVVVVERLSTAFCYRFHVMLVFFLFNFVLKVFLSLIRCCMFVIVSFSLFFFYFGLYSIHRSSRYHFIIVCMCVWMCV